jgi:hypothetical protein
MSRIINNPTGIGTWGDMAEHWKKKKLSKSDAQQKTPRGYPIPYLRLTRSGNPVDHQTWFRDTFFNSAAWGAGHFGEHDVEEAHVDLHVTICGQGKGMRMMKVTHDSNRQATGRNTPNTWLHYDQVTRGELQDQDVSGRSASLHRDNNGTYHFTVY